MRSRYPARFLGCLPSLRPLAAAPVDHVAPYASVPRPSGTRCRGRSSSQQYPQSVASGIPGLPQRGHLRVSRLRSGARRRTSCRQAMWRADLDSGKPDETPSIARSTFSTAGCSFSRFIEILRRELLDRVAISVANPLRPVHHNPAKTSKTHLATLSPTARTRAASGARTVTVWRRARSCFVDERGEVAVELSAMAGGGKKRSPFRAP